LPYDIDFPPDVIESIYDELEDQAEASRVLGELGAAEAGWLALHIRERLEKERASAQEELENEVKVGFVLLDPFLVCTNINPLKHLCPRREVRNFRVIIVEDACTRRRPANRKAQLTVWDVLNLSFSEGAEAGTFEMGQRYLVRKV